MGCALRPRQLRIAKHGRLNSRRFVLCRGAGVAAMRTHDSEDNGAILTKMQPHFSIRRAVPFGHGFARRRRWASLLFGFSAAGIFERVLT